MESIRFAPHPHWLYWFSETEFCSKEGELIIRSAASLSRLCWLLCLAILCSSFTSAQTKINPNQIASGTIPSNLAFTGTLTCKQFENVRCVDAANSGGWTGTTEDAWISAACSSLPSSGGIVDAREMGGGASIWASQVSCGSNSKPVTFIFDPSTHHQAATSAQNIWKVEPSNRIVGFTFDCANQPSYSGTIFQTDTGANFQADGTLITESGTDLSCQTVTTGTFANLNSTAVTTGVIFVTLSRLRINGLAKGVILQSSNSGFTNGNKIQEALCQGTTVCYTLNNTTRGHVNGNQLIAVDHEELPNSGTRHLKITSDGTGAISFNRIIGYSWDTLTWGTLSAATSVFNGNDIDIDADGICSGSCGFSTNDTGYNTFWSHRFAPTSALASLGSNGPIWLLNHSGNGIKQCAVDLSKCFHLFTNSSSLFQLDGVSVGTAAEFSATGAGAVLAGTGTGSLIGGFLKNNSGIVAAIPSPTSAGSTIINGFRTSVAGSTNLLAANTCGDTVTVTATGATTSMDAHASGAISSGLIERAWVSSLNTVSVQYCNVTTSGITPSAATLQVTIYDQ